MIELRPWLGQLMKGENIFLSHSLIKCISLLEFDNNIIL